MFVVVRLKRVLELNFAKYRELSFKILVSDFPFIFDKKDSNIPKLVETRGNQECFSSTLTASRINVQKIRYITSSSLM